VPARHRDHEVGLPEHLPVELAAPVPAQIEPPVGHGGHPVVGGRHAARVETGRRHRRRHAGEVEVTAEQGLRHR
jgi:hypothetical protein